MIRALNTSRRAPSPGVFPCYGYLSIRCLDIPSGCACTKYQTYIRKSRITLTTLHGIVGEAWP